MFIFSSVGGIEVLHSATSQPSGNNSELGNVCALGAIC